MVVLAHRGAAEGGGAVVLLPPLSEAVVPQRWEAGQPAILQEEEGVVRGGWYRQCSISLICRSPPCRTLAVVVLAYHQEGGQSQAHK